MKKHAWVFWLVAIALAFYFRTKILAEAAKVWALAKADFQGAGATAAANLPATSTAATVTAASTIADTVANAQPAPAAFVAFPITKYPNLNGHQFIF